MNIYDKKDSTGICFIGERKFKDFLKNYIPAKPGDIVTLADEKIGTHEGVMFYTIGQRQGLGVGGKQGLPAGPWYVVDKDINSNKLVVVQGRENDALFHTTIITKNLKAKTRYRQTDQSCVIRYISNTCNEVHFAAPQWAIAPGQSVVFYQHNTCLGGAIIEQRRI